MEYIIEADRLINSISFRLFGARKQDIINYYNMAIFTFINNEDLKMVEFSYRKLIHIDKVNKQKYLEEIRLLKPGDISIVEEIAISYALNGINPCHLYYNLATEINNLDYYKKALRFTNNDPTLKIIILQKIRDHQAVDNV